MATARLWEGAGWAAWVRCGGREESQVWRAERRVRMVAREVVAREVAVRWRVERMRRLRVQRLEAAARKPGGVLGPGLRIWGVG